MIFREPTKQELELIRSMVADGHTLNQIRQALNANYSTLIRWADENSIVLPDPIKAVMPTSQQISAIKRMKSQGYTKKAIAEKLGITISLAYRWIGRNKAVHFYTPSDKDKIKIKEMFIDQQKPIREIADAIGIGRDRMWEVIHELKLKRLPHRIHNRNRQITENEKERIAILIGQGKTCYAISKEMEVCGEVVNRWIKELGLRAVVKQRPRFIGNPEAIEKVKEMALSGCTRYKICKHLGIQPVSLNRILNELGIDLPKGKAQKAEKIKRVRVKSNVAAFPKPVKLKEKQPTKPCKPSSESTMNLKRFDRPTDPNDRVENSIFSRFKHLGSCRAY
jgi:transposase